MFPVAGLPHKVAEGCVLVPLVGGVKVVCSTTPQIYPKAIFPLVLCEASARTVEGMVRVSPNLAIEFARCLLEGS